jgi:VWFA-related protein
MRWTVAPVAALLAFGSPASAQRNDQAPSIDLVEVDVSVVDRKQNPVIGLTARDFSVKEDGVPVDVKTFLEVRPTTPEDPDNLRSIVLLLDDAAVPIAGTQAMQIIGKAFLDGADAHDDISIVRLRHGMDEPFGDRSVAVSRLLQFQGAPFPSVDGSTPVETLGRVAGIARQLDVDDHRRKAIVCIGAPIVCNVEEPSPATTRPRLWTSWVDAVSAAARVNAAVYSIIPGRAPLRGGGLSELTGGEVFATMYDVGPAVDRILAEAASYYMLGYWPAGKSRVVHSIDVKVARRGVKVRARRRRGG